MTSANTTVNCDDPALLDSVAVKATKTVAYSVLLLLSLVGNSVVPVVIYRNRELHTCVNYFIASMSISDLLIPTIALPERIRHIYIPHDIWQIDGNFGSLLCKLRSFLTDTSIIVTVLTLVIVSLERFFAVKYPFKTQPLRNRKSCFIVISLTWVFAMICSSRNFYTWRLTTVNSTTTCVRRWKPAFNSAEAGKIENIVFQVLFLIIPLFVLIIVYSTMIVYFQRKKSPAVRLELPQSRLHKAKMYQSITYMLLTVILVFFIPATSITIYTFLIYFVLTDSHPCSMRHSVRFSLFYLGYLCQAFNPYIYCIFNKRYTEGFKKVLCCATKCNYCKIAKGEAQEDQTRKSVFPKNKNVTSTTAAKMSLLMISSV